MKLKPETLAMHNEASLYKAVIFELDEVIFPRRDYVLQIYYLFAAFIEYTELQPSAQTLVQTFKEVYEAEGEKDIFEKIAPVFHIPEKYQQQLLNLYHTARLPQKLWMFQKTFELIQILHLHGKKIWVVTQGAVEEQVNKIKQLEWNGLQSAIQVYFVEEHPEKNKALLISDLLNQHQIHSQEALMVYADTTDAFIAKALDIEAMAINDL